MLRSLPLHVLGQCVQFVQWLVLLARPSCGKLTLHLLDWTDSQQHFTLACPHPQTFNICAKCLCSWKQLRHLCNRMCCTLS